MKRMVSRGTAAALCLLTAAGSFNVAYLVFQQHFNAMLPDYRANAAIYEKLSQVRATVDKYYVGEYELQDAIDMAAAGFMSGVGDRWSSYMSAEQSAKYALTFSGKANGVGVSIIRLDGEDCIRIYEVAAGSAAAEAGITTDDVIVGAGGRMLVQDGYEAVLEAMRGEEGAEITVVLRRDGETRTESLTCGTYAQTLVNSRMLSDGKTGFIRFYSFWKTSEDQFAQALDALLAQGAERIIFDVRDNPGGSVDSLCDILDPLLPAGVTMTMRTVTDRERVYTSDAQALDLPMAVLVNASSYSAAEFFAAALQEYGKAVIVGEPTIGKGYSQRTYTLSDGSALRLSDQEYFTPQGRSLIGTGVTPDIEIPLTEEKHKQLSLLDEAQDDQLQAALAALDDWSGF